MTWTDPAFSDVADFVRTCAGLVFPPARHGEVEVGTRKVMASVGLCDVREFLQRVGSDTPLLDALISEVTIGETYFFREPGHFAFIHDEVVPEIRRLRGATHVIRAWSAGCASGEEAYSLAALFDEIGLAEQSRVLATDISRPQLARARNGIYGGWSLRGDGARAIRAYLRPIGSRFRLHERIRQRVEVAYLNLARDTYPTVATSTWGMDLVLCRNVFIYFDPDTTEAVARRLYACLAPGGYLIAGSSDPLIGGCAPFETLTTPAGVVYRKSPELREASGTPFAMPAVALAEGRGGAKTETRGGRPQVDGPRHVGAQSAASAQAVAKVRRDASQSTGRAPGEVAHDVERAEMDACISRLRELANAGDVTAAAATATRAVARYPMSEEIGFLHAILLMNLDRYDDAERALRRVLYLNRLSLAALFALGSTLHRLGKVDGAIRAFQTARRIAAQRPADEVVPLTDGERAAHLAAAIDVRLKSLGAQRERVR